MELRSEPPRRYYGQVWNINLIGFSARLERHDDLLIDPCLPWCIIIIPAADSEGKRARFKRTGIQNEYQIRFANLGY